MSEFNKGTILNNLLRSAKVCKVEKYLYTSTIGVYAPAEVFSEDDVWKKINK